MGQHGLEGGSLAHGRWVRAGWFLRSLSTQTMYDYSSVVLYMLHISSFFISHTYFPSLLIAFHFSSEKKHGYSFPFFFSCKITGQKGISGQSLKFFLSIVLIFLLIFSSQTNLLILFLFGDAKSSEILARNMLLIILNSQLWQPPDSNPVINLFLFTKRRLRAVLPHFFMQYL